jgi:protein arginine kinase activator
MLCDGCKKRPASVHITEIKNNQKAEKHLCEQCAKTSGEAVFSVDQQFTVQDLLKGMFKLALTEATHQKAEVTCPQCGLTYADFSRNGKIGCSGCFNAFGQRLEPLLRRIHGNNVHTGKIPKRAGVQLEAKQRLQQLRKQLEQQIALEEYEQAAKIRDAIKAIEEDLRLQSEG